MQGKIILVTGGARSGKSLFAEQYAIAQKGEKAYIATAQVYDAEMAARVALHQARRAEEWKTFEAPYDAHHALTLAAQQAGTVLFDCLTLYTSNLLLKAPETATPEETHHRIMAQIEQLLSSARSAQATVIFVTNEVGMGIVPDNALARQYRDIAGSVNQKVAAWADEVYLVISGIAVEIKTLAVQMNKEVTHG